MSTPIKSQFKVGDCVQLNHLGIENLTRTGLYGERNTTITNIQERSSYKKQLPLITTQDKLCGDNRTMPFTLDEAYIELDNTIMFEL